MPSARPGGADFDPDIELRILRQMPALLIRISDAADPRLEFADGGANLILLRNGEARRGHLCPGGAQRLRGGYQSR